MIKMLFLNIILLISLCMATCFAQDPGMPDSLIIDTVFVPYDSGQFSSHYIPVYFVTDDSVVFIEMSLTWNSPDIFLGRSVWRYPFTAWDVVFDSVDIGHQQIRFILFSDIGGGGNPPIYTDSMRLRGLDLRFIIGSSAQPQFVWIDTVEAVVFDGYYPRFQRGYIRYGDVSAIQGISNLPEELTLSPNYPNPFNTQTIINFEINKPSAVRLDIYDITGALIGTLIDQTMSAGKHKALWDASAFSSGIYFSKLTIEDKTQTRKMLLIK